MVPYLAGEGVLVYAEAEGKAPPEVNPIEGFPKGSHGLRVSLLLSMRDTQVWDSQDPLKCE